MEVKYEIRYQAAVIRKHIPKLSSSIKKIIKRGIEERLGVDPVGFGKPLRYSLKGHRRLRVGDYRIVYFVEEHTVIIIAIKHRKEIYEK